MIEQLYTAFLQTRGVSIDTRSIKLGDVFFALKGPNFDGNMYASAALEAGANIVVVDDQSLDVANDDRYFLVKDSLTTLQDLASLHRSRSKAKVLSITGSNGKTTTKELVAAVLQTSYDIIFTKGNFNNHIGVPLTLLSIQENTEIAIVEMGANHIGEIKDLCKIAHPDYGLITNIGKAHLEGFGSVEGVMKAKGELFTSVKNNKGHLFVHDADRVLVKLAGDYPDRTEYSIDASFDKTTSIEVEEIDGQLRIGFEWEGDYHSEQMSLYGDYNVPNLLAALNIGYYFDIPPEESLKALAFYVPANSRSQRIQTNCNEIYLDAYNANPSSMEHAMKAFAKIQASNKVVILGDMFELGIESDLLHQEIADLALGLFKEVILVGAHFSKVETIGVIYPNTIALLKQLKKMQLTQSTILLKGSRGMKLEKLLDVL